MCCTNGVTEANYRIEFVDRILDPVHGFIDLTQVEKEIIELPIFKRLQSLKQLSLTNWVFPGAEHTRYMHSLGVMHIADLMAQNLRDTDYKLKYNDGQRQLLRLAGLLHDIGHYPLSHVTEYVYNARLLDDDDTLQSKNREVKNKIDRLAKPDAKVPDYMMSRYSKVMHHETIGTKVIESSAKIQAIIAKYCPFIDIDDIKDIIVGCVERKPEISAMVQLMHSELDADGIDYIMRDATFSGTSYGGFELGLLLRNLAVASYNGIDIVGIRPKGISVVDQYLISKYFSYTQVIFNRHVAIFDQMAEMFSKALIVLSQSNYPRPEQLVKHIEQHERNDVYLKFTDRAFWSQLDSIQADELSGYVAEYIVAMYHKLSHYQEIEMVNGGEVIITSDDRQRVYDALTQSQVYNDIANRKEGIMALFHTRGFTSQINIENFAQRLQVLRGHPIDNDEFIKRNSLRLQEGIAVIEKGDEPRLLVDDSRSIMSHLAETKTYILREYCIGG